MNNIFGGFFEGYTSIEIFFIGLVIYFVGFGAAIGLFFIIDSNSNIKSGDEIFPFCIFWPLAIVPAIGFLVVYIIYLLVKSFFDDLEFIKNNKKI